MTGWMMIEIYDDGGLRVSRLRGRREELLSVEVLVIGGEWSISAASVERLYRALGAWLDDGVGDE